MRRRLADTPRRAVTCCGSQAFLADVSIPEQARLGRKRLHGRRKPPGRHVLGALAQVAPRHRQGAAAVGTGQSSEQGAVLVG